MREPEREALRASLVAACTQTSAMVLPAQVGFVKASFAVDTGASVNVLSEDSYSALAIEFTTFQDNPIRN